MNNAFSLKQISQTGNLDGNLITRQYGLDPMAKFMEIQSMNPRFRQDQIAKEIGSSSSTFKLYRNINMLSAYRIPSNTKERK